MVKVKAHKRTIKQSDLKIGSKSFSALKNEDRFGFVITGAGGKPQEWVNGFAKVLKKEGIVKSSNVFSDAYFVSGNVLGDKGRKDLVLIFSKESKPDGGMLAMWRLRVGNLSWIDDFIDNYAKDYQSPASKQSITNGEKFIADMESAGYEVDKEYHGRYFYSGPAVSVDKDGIQDVIRATDLKLQQDHLGLGIILYPYRPDEKYINQRV